MKVLTRRLTMFIAFAAVTAVPFGTCLAADSPSSAPGNAMSDRELASLRGGYITGSGLEIAVGIKDSVFVDGVLQVMNTLNLPPLGENSGHLTAEQLSDRTTTVRQFGPGNTIAPGLFNNLQPGQFTVIQNSLDHAVIRNVTEISATVTVLNLYRDMNLRSVMNQQLVNAVR